MIPLRTQQDVGTWGVVVLSRLADPPWHGDRWTIATLSDTTGLSVPEVVEVLLDDLGDRVRLDRGTTSDGGETLAVESGEPRRDRHPEGVRGLDVPTVDPSSEIVVSLPIDPSLEGFDRWTEAELDGTGLPDPGLEVLT